MSDENRRLMGVIVTGDTVAEFVREGKRTIEVPSTVPETATFVMAWFDHERNAFVTVFQDVSFDRVADGCSIPILFMPNVVITVPGRFI